MLFGNFFEFHIFNKKENILVSSSKDPALAWYVLDGIATRDEYIILSSFSVDVTDYCEQLSKKELSL